MHAPDAATLLNVWERGLQMPLQRNAIALLAAALSGQTREQIAALPIGRRDGLLLRLRELLFGSDIAAVANCPKCGERLEAGFPIARIQVASIGPGPEAIEYEALAFRLPATEDLLAVPQDAAPEAGRRILLTRCLVKHGDPNQPAISCEQLTDANITEIAQKMADADPQADVELSLNCSACAHSFSAAFDIAAFLWSEVNEWARQALFDVDALARAYGWSEASILGMSPRRRQIYLDMARR